MSDYASHIPPHESVAQHRPEDFIAAEDPTMPPSEGEAMVCPGMNWFVLRVAINKESAVQKILVKKIKVEGYEHLVNRILVPTEKARVSKNGKIKVVENKLYPGYVFVEMRLEPDGRIPQDIFFLFKETTGVGDFIGTAGRPTPITIPEVEKMLLASRPPEEQPQVQADYKKGDFVRITGGALAGMEGVVDEVMPEQNKVRVIATIFGRSTPTELDLWEVSLIKD